MRWPEAVRQLADTVTQLGQALDRRVDALEAQSRLQDQRTRKMVLIAQALAKKVGTDTSEDPNSLEWRVRQLEQIARLP